MEQFEVRQGKTSRIVLGVVFLCIAVGAFIFYRGLALSGATLRNQLTVLLFGTVGCGLLGALGLYSGLKAGVVLRANSEGITDCTAKPEVFIPWDAVKGFDGKMLGDMARLAILFVVPIEYPAPKKGQTEKQDVRLIPLGATKPGKKETFETLKAMLLQHNEAQQAQEEPQQA